ncbi:ATP-binding protein, partial [Bacillus thuringiensis]
MKKTNGNWKDFFEIIRKTKPNIRLFTFAIIIASISAIISSFIPNFLKNLIDSYAASGTFNGIVLLGFIALFLSGTILGAIGSYLLSVVGLKVVANLREITWVKIVKLPTEFYDKNRSGDIASRVVNDTTVIYDLVSNSFSQFINAILMILFCGFWLFYY